MMGGNSEEEEEGEGGGCCCRHLPDYGDPDVVSVHGTLVLGGYGGCVVLLVFSVVLPLISPDEADGRLRYISDGFFAQCGATNLAMGMGSLPIAVCELLVAVHMRHRTRWAELCVVIQTVAWFVVLCVEFTQWGVHYVGLGVFLVSSLGFHQLASHDRTWGGPVYVRCNYLAILFAVVFAVCACASMLNATAPGLQSWAVAFEYVLMSTVVAQCACVVGALDRFRDIRLRFEA